MAAQVSVPKFSAIDGWGEAAPRPEWASDVAIDANDRAYLFARKDPLVLVYDGGGELLSTWGEDTFLGRPHGISIGADGFAYCVEDHGSTVRKFTLDGKAVSTFGPTGDRDDGNDAWDWKKKQLLVQEASIVETLKELEPEGGPPYNQPTKADIAANGDVYVADGYRNCKVHRFSPDGELLHSWGRSGSGPGEFHLLHSIMVSPQGKVYVTDRENDRIQIFDLDGVYLSEWTNVHRPHGVKLGPGGLFYVGEARVKVGRYTFTHGVATSELPVRISVRDDNGAILDEITGDELVGDPHAFAFDSNDDLYIVASRKLRKYQRIA